MVIECAHVSRVARSRDVGGGSMESKEALRDHSQTQVNSSQADKGRNV